MADIRFAYRIEDESGGRNVVSLLLLDLGEAQKPPRTSAAYDAMHCGSMLDAAAQMLGVEKARITPIAPDTYVIDIDAC